jgi:archaetidylinositol phosphate synthase
VSHDTLIHRLVRPAVRPLVRTSVTPNQLTTLRLLTGLGAAAAFASGGPWRDLGAGVFLVSLLLDRADGELARQSGKISAGGYRYDLACDCIATVAAFIGLGMGLEPVFGPWGVALGLIAGGAIVGLFYQINVSKVASAKGVGVSGRVLVDPDDAMALIPPLIWLGLAAPTLVLAATLTPLVMIILMIRGRPREGGRPSQSRTKPAAS